MEEYEKGENSHSRRRSATRGKVNVGEGFSSKRMTKKAKNSRFELLF